MYQADSSDVHEVSSQKLCTLLLLHDIPDALNTLTLCKQHYKLNEVQTAQNVIF